MVSKRGTRWRARVFLPDGRERTKAFGTKREALAWEAAERTKPAETSETLGTFVERTQAHVLGGLSPATAATYRSHVKHRIVPWLGHWKMATITAAQVEAAAMKWRTKVSSSVVTGTLNCLSRFYRHAMKTGQVRENPVREVDRPRADPVRAVPTLSSDEVTEVVARCTRVRPVYGDYVRLAVGLGLRAGELLALRVMDVDLEQQVVTVRQAWSAGKLGPPKWGRSRRVLIVGDAREVLAARVAGRRTRDLVLCTETGGRLYHSHFNAAVGWPRMMEELGLAGTHFHDLRATAIVGWIRAGLPLSTVRDMAGHSSLTTTNVYARLARTDLTDALAQLESYQIRTIESRTSSEGSGETGSG